ncbi:hypothetical protein ACIBHX_06720 [Nonomuraea sp. NPDC050536]|uniref:Rv1678 family membrane protein n=1 Tax=Nonomuraea sp. NPDC050536 TaxID=3364366 RepID=UPI0037C85A73
MKAAMVLGIVSLVSAVLVLVSNARWQFVSMTWRTAIVAVVLGVLAIVVSRLGRARLVAVVGLIYLLAALVQLVELGVGAHWLGGTGSTVSLWLGLGAGLLALGLYGGPEPLSAAARPGRG